MNHSFDIELACEFSIEEAILIHNFAYWIEKNRKNEINFYDGRFWSYDSVRALTEQFPYMTQKKLYRVINVLCDKGILMKGNYNKKAYDRTSWYAFTDLGDSICEKYRLHIPKNGKCIPQNGKMDLPEWENGFARMGTPIPDTTTNTTTDIIREEGEINFTSTLPQQDLEIITPYETECTSIVPKEKGKGVARAKFIKPSIDDVRNYCIEISSNIDPEYFFDHYESNGWRVGVNKMKDWKSTVRNWSKKQNNFNSHGIKTKQQQFDEDLSRLGQKCARDSYNAQFITREQELAKYKDVPF